MANVIVCFRLLLSDTVALCAHSETIFEAVRVVVAPQLGCKACEPHTCVCVETWWLPVATWTILSQKFSDTPTSQPFEWHHVESNLASSGASSYRASQPDAGRQQTTWWDCQRKTMAWDVTVPDTYAKSHIGNTSTKPGSAAQKAAQNQSDKYARLSRTNTFWPFAIETAGTIRP